MICEPFAWTWKRRRWYQSIALAVGSLISRPLYMLTTYYTSQLSTTPCKFRLHFDICISSGNLNVSNGNTSMVTQDLCAKVIISGCFLIAAMEQTNIIGRTYISAKALSMDLRTSAVEEIVENGSDIISGYIYFRGKYSDVSKAVKLSRSKVKQIYGKKCVPFD